MAYKLICSDIDGTLLDKDRELSVTTIAEIKRIKDKIPFILISSRMPMAMTHLQAQLEILQSPLIAYNGALILTYGTTGNPEILSSIEIPSAIMSSIVKFNASLKIHTSLYHNDDWFVAESDYWANREQNNTKVSPKLRVLQEVCDEWCLQQKGPHKIMCMGDVDQVQLLADFISSNFKGELNAYRSKPTYLEISSKKISKLSALSHLLDSNYQISLKDVVAFGDNYNDVEMIQGVGHGVAVNNAKDEVKLVANSITSTNKEDGVAKALRKLF